ncbi:MAG: OmpA family protein [Bacteroidales bacterium]|nr:OmpA family protein [Bacteroidales bacterium]
MKRSFIKITIIAILSLLVSRGFSAERCSRHEFSVYGGGGLSTLNYKVNFGTQRMNLGGHFGFGYRYFFSPNWALGTSVELEFYRTRFDMDNLSFRFMTTDMQGVEFEFRSIVSNFEERQRAMLLQIPLMLQFQTNKPGRQHQFYAAVGGKIGIPVRGRYNSTADFRNAGYFSYENSLYDTQEFMGFGNFPNRRSQGSLNFKTSFFLSAETGIKWRLNDRHSLYTGLYIDYGLNNIARAASTRPTLIEYNKANPRAFVVNSIINSQYTPMGSNTAQVFTDKIRPIAIGIKMRLTFGRGCERRNAQAASQAILSKTISQQPNSLQIVQSDYDEETQKALAGGVVGEAAEETLHKAGEATEEERMNAIIKQLGQPIDRYALNQVEPGEYQKQKLDEKIALLKQYPNLKFYIQGHTCDIGTREANERVGFGRDVGVRAYIISQGIDPSRILGVECKRDTMPLVPNTSEENRRKNRRVQLIIVQ